MDEQLLVKMDEIIRKLKLSHERGPRGLRAESRSVCLVLVGQRCVQGTRARVFVPATKGLSVRVKGGKVNR